MQLDWAVAFFAVCGKGSEIAITLNLIIKA